MAPGDLVKSAAGCKKEKDRPGLSVWCKDGEDVAGLAKAGAIKNGAIRTSTVARILAGGFELEETGSPHCTVWLPDECGEETLMELAALFDEPVPNPAFAPEAALASSSPDRQLWCDFNERDDSGLVLSDVQWAEDSATAFYAGEELTVGDDEGNRCGAVIQTVEPSGLIRLDVHWDSFVPV